MVYPKLGQIASLHPNPAIVLGRPIYWTVKEDGSNIGCYLNEDGKCNCAPAISTSHRLNIWSEKSQTFLSYPKVYQEAYHANIPIVELVLISLVATLDRLYETRDSLLEMCKECKHEGVDGKVYGDESIS